VGPRTGLDDVKSRKFLTLPGLELRPLGRRARSQSLYRLSYRGSLLGWVLSAVSAERLVPVRPGCRIRTEPITGG
jgi:hypothetical protein